jgi:uncharacterized protein (TIGR00661 family)
MKVLYGICSWGLGHATRSLPVIRKLVRENNELVVISSGRSIDLLKTELGNDVEYLDIPDYPMLLSENSRQFMAKSLIYWPLFIRKMESGLQIVTKLIEKNNYDLIISDARYDVYSKKIPSYFISHQMRIMNPLRIKKLESGSEIFNLFFFKRFREVIVPDFKDDNLSGELSHNLKRIDESIINYVGVLSDFSKKRTKKDVDYFISISGPEPQRTLFEEKILSQIDQINGNIVITLGKTEINEKLKNENITTYTFLSKKEREDLLNRTKLVISRSGYSTILDLAVIGTKALMVPTPGQIEQEYLGQYHSQKRSFFSINQDKINLKENVQRAKRFTGITRKCDVNSSVENIMQVVYNTM